MARRTITRRRKAASPGRDAGGEPAKATTAGQDTGGDPSRATAPGHDLALAAGLVVFWSSGFIGAKLATDEADTTAVLMWRFLLAAGLLLAWRLLRTAGRRRLTPREIGLQALIGLLAQSVYLLGTVKAVELGVATGTTALIAALQPIMAGALAGPVLGERVAPRQWAGLVVGLAGVGIVVNGDLTSAEGASALAYLLPFAGTAGLVAATLLQRRTAAETPVADALAVHCAVSAVVFSGLAVLGGHAAPPADGGFWAAVAWTIVLSTFGGYALYWLNLQRGSVTRVSSLLYLTPPTTMVWALLMFGEPVHATTLAGMAVCLAGVLLVQLRGRDQASAARSAAPTSPTARRESSEAASQRQKPCTAPS
jgi:drug/metabolite transporter (DMT)-like permease